MLQLPQIPFPTIQKFLQDNDVVVYYFMTLSIAKAIKENADKTELFSFGGNGENIAIVKRKDYNQVLNDAVKKFAGAEEYEKAAFAQSILDKWNVELFLNENKNKME
jgi:hypothetical protein